MTPSPAFGLFWTPYADWIYTAVSLSGVLLICWLVLGRSNPCTQAAITSISGSNNTSRALL